MIAIRDVLHFIASRFIVACPDARFPVPSTFDLLQFNHEMVTVSWFAGLQKKRAKARTAKQ
jgi:hypothetical protein